MSVGEQLRRARTERRLSIAQVTAQTNIQPWIVEALEADRLPESMSAVYVKGFLSTYARFLRLEPERLVSEFAWPQPPAEPEPQTAPVPSVPVTLHVPWQALRWAAVVIVVGIVGVVVVRAHPIQRVGALVQRLRVQAASAKVAARSDVKRSPPKVAKTEPKPAKTASLSSVQARLASVTPVQEVPKTPPPPPPDVQPLTPLELTVSASRSTWIQVRADGKLLTQQWLKRGSNERWTAKKRFELIISKPSQVALALNGQPINTFAITHRGRLVITHQGITALPQE